MKQDHCAQIVSSGRREQEEEEEEEGSGTEIHAMNSSRKGVASVPLRARPCEMLTTRKFPPRKSDHTAGEWDTAGRGRNAFVGPALHRTCGTIVHFVRDYKLMLDSRCRKGTDARAGKRRGRGEKG